VGSASAPIQVDEQPRASHVANEEDLRAAAVEPKDPPLQGQVEHQKTPGSSSSFALLRRLILEHGAGRPRARYERRTTGRRSGTQRSALTGASGTSKDTRKFFVFALLRLLLLRERAQDDQDQPRMVEPKIISGRQGRHHHGASRRGGYRLQQDWTRLLWTRLLWTRRPCC
jgi:hypothetical protein